MRAALCLMTFKLPNLSAHDKDYYSYLNSMKNSCVLTFVQLHWDMSPDRPDESIVMTLAEFAEQVAIVERAFFEYWRLNDKYERFAKLGQKS